MRKVPKKKVSGLAKIDWHIFNIKVSPTFFCSPKFLEFFFTFLLNITNLLAFHADEDTQDIFKTLHTTHSKLFIGF